MSRIDTLPADQRAVLELLLRQGRRYAELSDLLRIDEALVRMTIAVRDLPGRAATA